MLDARISNEQRLSIYKRDNFRCALCDGVRGIQIHHVIPRGRGGNNSNHNLITLCMYCHGIAHGTKWADGPDSITQEDIELACTEYLSDYYAGQGEIWAPWEPDREGDW